MTFTAKQRETINRAQIDRNPDLKRDGYLVRKKSPRTCAHVWRSGDTLCRMASTGGMNLRRYTVVDQADRAVCQLCENVELGIHDANRALNREFREIIS